MPPSDPKPKHTPPRPRSRASTRWGPWAALALVGLAFAGYGMHTQRQRVAQRAAHAADQLRIERLEKTVFELREQMEIRNRDFQSLKALYAQSGRAAPALHVVGVYEGKTPPGVDDRPWWARCEPTTGSTPSPEAVQAARLECHRKHAGERVEKEVSVDLSDTTRPIVLALSAYSKTNWKVKLAPGVELQRVILSGYESQRITGLPESMPIETFTYEASPCPRCVQGGRHFHSWESPALPLREITGLEVTSFQGKYKGESFSIFPGVTTVSRELATRN